MSTEERVPTTQRLADTLRAANAPESMIQAALEGFYDDFKSPSLAPILDLEHEAHQLGLHDIARRARAGEFDAPKWEADEWAASPDGQVIIKECFGVSASHTEVPRFRRRPRK